MKPLDPRKTPYTRGDVVTRGFKQVGMVTDYTPAYLEVRWNDEGNEGNDKIERVPMERVDDLLRVAHADTLFSTDGQTNLQTLNGIEALERIQVGIRNRIKTIRSPAEQAEVDGLVKRAFASDGCAWDKKNQGQLMHLIVEPQSVGAFFKIRERVHRMFCRHHTHD